MRPGAQKDPPRGCQRRLCSCLNFPVSDANPAFSARFSAAFPVWGKGCGVSSVWGNELWGQRCGGRGGAAGAAAGSGEDASVAATPRRSCEDPGRQSGPARGNAGKHKVVEEGQDHRSCLRQPPGRRAASCPEPGAASRMRLLFRRR